MSIRRIIRWITEINQDGPRPWGVRKYIPDGHEGKKIQSSNLRPILEPVA